MSERKSGFWTEGGAGGENPSATRLERFYSTRKEVKNLNINDIAKVCHEANKALCEGLGDHSQAAWENAQEWQRTSARNGVEFNIVNPTAPASASHDYWLAEKEAAGWKFGPVKDAEKKEHPCFVPYEQLPKEQQAKDHLFKAVVAALAPLVQQ